MQLRVKYFPKKIIPLYLKLQQFITSVYNKISVVKVYISYLYIYENCEFEKLNEMVTNATRLRFHCR